MSPTVVRLQQLARTQGLNVDALARLYVLEGMLDRIFASPFAADFVSEGGVLLAAYALRRPTKDIDVEGSRIRNNAMLTPSENKAIDARRVLGLAAACMDPNETTLNLVVRSEPELRGIAYMAALDDIEAAVEAVIGFTIDAIGEDYPSAEAAHRIPLFTPSSEPTQSFDRSSSNLGTHNDNPIPLSCSASKNPM